MNETLRTVTRLTGWACTAIGLGHIALGVERSVPGAGEVSPTVESQESFYNAVFVGYGLTWLHAARDGRTDRAVEAAAVMGLGGIARVVAAARRGAPSPLLRGTDRGRVRGPRGGRGARPQGPAGGSFPRLMLAQITPPTGLGLARVRRARE